MNRKLLKYLKPYWYLAILSPLCMFIEVILDLVQPDLMGKIIDEDIATGNWQNILTRGLIMLSLALVGALGGLGGNVFGTMASQNFANDLRKDAFTKVMSLSNEQTDSFTTGSLVTRLTNDITAVQDFVGMALRMFVRTPMNFIGGIFMILQQNIKFGFILLATIPIEILCIVIFIKRANPLFSMVQKKLDRVNSVVQENLSGARVVKAFVQEEYEKKRFDGAATDLTENTLKVQRLMAKLMPLVSIFMNITVMSILFLGGKEVDLGNMEVGQISAATIYIVQILFSMMMLSMMFQSIARANASAARIKELLDTVPTITDGDGSFKAVDSENIIEFRNVEFTYSGLSGKPVLSDINLTIRRGERIAIMGSTGSGKTSLVSLLPRFYNQTAGEIIIDGRPVEDYELESLRHKISFTLQKAQLFSGTIADNIRYGKEDATDEEVLEAARIAQADEFIESFKDGYDTIIGEKGASLSGGQKQRLSIARAVIRKPQIIIFDDSTSALDLATEAKLSKALDEALSDCTVIKVAQRVSSVRNFDRIVVLDGGTICSVGNHDELMKTSPVYRDIYISQEKGGAEE